jgi:diguanylate cyclase (GGDEF)-like protein
VSVLLLTTLVGSVVWLVSDRYQSAELSSIFQQKLKQELKTEARNQRQQFLEAIKSYNAAVRLYASNSEIKNYVTQQGWQKQSHEQLANQPLILHEGIPEWLPKLSIMRNFILPRYAMLFDGENNLRELYHYKHPLPPKEILNISNHQLELSREQSHVTLFEGQPYLIATEYIGGQDKIGSLLLLTPIDNVFLCESLSEGSNSVIALLKDGVPEVLVSSDSSRVPVGSNAESLEAEYLLTGEDHFATGSSDFMVNFVSLLSKQEVENQTKVVLLKDRQTRAMNAFFFFIAFALIMFWITYRIQKLTQKVVEFSSGRAILQPRLKKGDQIEELTNRFELLAAAIEKETSELEYQAYHDLLTNMPNRALFNNRLQYELLNGERNNLNFVLMVSDLNHFKEINDTLGHHIGDLVIQKAAERLQHALRKNDTVARLGGDEFGMLLPDTTLEEAKHAVKKIFTGFNAPFIVEGNKLDVAISIGLAEYPTHGKDINILMQRADVAMYNAKNNKTGWSIYQSIEDKNTVTRLALMRDLKQAIENNTLELFYQPIINLNTNKICSVEALLRWNHYIRGYIPPNDFIPLAEQTGLIQPLTNWVIEKAALQCNEWKSKNYDVGVSINISVNCLQDNKLLENMLQIISSHDMQSSNYVFEMTESVFMKDPVKVKKILTKISDMGIGISIDDFGVGYSSMTYMKQLPVNELKIDRSFIQELLAKDNDTVIVKATIELAHNLGLSVVAEGVENEETLNILKKLGCDKAQGYYLGKPAPSVEITKLLKQAQPDKIQKIL